MWSKVKRIFVLLKQEEKLKYVQGDVVKYDIFEGDIIVANKDSFVLDCSLSNIKNLMDNFGGNDLTELVRKYTNVWITRAND